MHDGRIKPCDPVGQIDELAAPLLGQLHQPNDFGKQRVIANRPHHHPNGWAKIDRTGKNPIARANFLRHTLTIDQACIDAGVAKTLGAVDDLTVDRDTLTRRNQNLLTDFQFVRRYGAGRTIRQLQQG